MYASPVSQCHTSRGGLVIFVKQRSQKFSSDVTAETHPHRCSYLLSPWFGYMLIPCFICTLLMGVFLFFFLRFQGLICLFSHLQLRRLMIICPPGECKQLPVSSSTDTGGGISLWSMKTVYCWVGWGIKRPSYHRATALWEMNLSCLKVTLAPWNLSYGLQHIRTLVQKVGHLKSVDKLEFLNWIGLSLT